MTKGKTNRKASNLSKKPPCPGSILPESLISILRFNRLSTKSPIVAKINTAPAIIYQTVGFNIDMDSNGDNLGKKLMFKYAKIKQNRPPPRKPSIVLLGDTCGISLFFPIKDPTI